MFFLRICFFLIRYKCAQNVNTFWICSNIYSHCLWLPCSPNQCTASRAQNRPLSVGVEWAHYRESSSLGTPIKCAYRTCICAFANLDINLMRDEIGRADSAAFEFVAVVITFGVLNIFTYEKLERGINMCACCLFQPPSPKYRRWIEQLSGLTRHLSDNPSGGCWTNCLEWPLIQIMLGYINK